MLFLNKNRNGNRNLSGKTIGKTLGLICAVVGMSWAGQISADSHSLYELRTYTANEGKIDALHDRFRNHTMTIFERHGMKNIAYWTPVDAPNKLIYIIAHKDGDSAKASWGAFVADPEWQKVYAASIADGRLVADIQSVFMTATDYSPK